MRASRMTTIATSIAAATAALFVVPALSGAAATHSGGTAFTSDLPGNEHVSIVFSRDGRQVKRAFVGYKFKCSDGNGMTDWDYFESLPVSARGKFKSSFDSGDQPSRVEAGTITRYAGSIKGARTRTAVVGTARFTLTLTRAGQQPVTCDTGAIKYTARD